MTLTKWWKCDLQVATPAWRFTMPADQTFDFDRSEDRQRFANEYMSAVRAKGIEVIALADHNSYEWIDEMRAAGKRHGVVVFPGCEVTTGTGADGIHLIVIGDATKSGRDFDLLLSGVLGFDSDHPRFHQVDGKRQPGSSPKTVTQILDELPDDFLVIAPHALGDNGIASGKTAHGDIRWRALHHHRLNAVDPGDCTDCAGDGFNARFRRRQLNDFPCLQTLTFVATSDAYRLDRIGARFAWVRMQAPTIEALRQAFLDHEARVLCDWDVRLNEYQNRNPNLTRHAWIESVELNGLQNSRKPLTLRFHPRLNVIIGGRGSGKSTVVAGLRQLYGTTEGLPERVKSEAEIFIQNILLGAELRSLHHLTGSQESQTATWTPENSSLTRHQNDVEIPTTFRVKVVNQKELFERVAQSRHDKNATSRSFLSFVDQSIGFHKVVNPSAVNWWRRLEQSEVEWATAIREHQLLKQDLSQVAGVKARIQELERQISAFDAPEAKVRRDTIRARRQEREAIEERAREIADWIDEVGRVSQSFPRSGILDLSTLANLRGPFDKLLTQLEQVAEGSRAAVEAAYRDGSVGLERWRHERASNEWGQAVATADADAQAYVEELRQKGIDPKAYSQLQSELQQQQALVKQLATKEATREQSRQRVDAAWSALISIIEERTKRHELLNDVSSKSGRLRFEVIPFADTNAWTESVRDLLNLRSDAFLDDVPALSHWLWRSDDGSSVQQRWGMWRNALSSNDFAAISTANLGRHWLRKLQGLDEAVRLRLATLFADDLVEMRFLRDGGDPQKSIDWQRIEEGSPGQRTAAMLAFVLHHGDEPLVLDQPEDDLDTEWISRLVVKELRASRWKRQLIVVTHNANVPVNGDAENVIVLENSDLTLRIRSSEQSGEDGALHPTQHIGAIETPYVREDIQNIMEGGITAFIQRERKYNNETRRARYPLPVLA